MLAGCSKLLSPTRHRLTSEATTQFQAVCNFQLPSMSTQRLDLPCSYNRYTSRSQPIRPVGLSVEKGFESKGSCSIRHKIRPPPSLSIPQPSIWEGRREVEDVFWEEEKKSLKRQNSTDECGINKVKRKRCSSDRELGSENIWFSQNVAGSGVIGTETPSLTAAKEERISFLPRSTPNPWMNFVVNEITATGDKDVETSRTITKVKSGSSNSSESRSLTLKPEENSPDVEIGNGIRVPYPSEGRLTARNGGDAQPEHQDFELLGFLVACVESISSKNMSAITNYLSRLGELASPEGNPICRVTVYFTEALALRAARLWPHVFHISVPRDIDRAEDETASG